MTSAVLHHRIAGPQHDLHAIVEFETDGTVHDKVVVKRGGAMHTGVVGSDHGVSASRTNSWTLSPSGASSISEHTQPPTGGKWRRAEGDVPSSGKCGGRR